MLGRRRTPAPNRPVLIAFAAGAVAATVAMCAYADLFPVDLYDSTDLVRRWIADTALALGMIVPAVVQLTATTGETGMRAVRRLVLVACAEVVGVGAATGAASPFVEFYDQIDVGMMCLVGILAAVPATFLLSRAWRLVGGPAPIGRLPVAVLTLFFAAALAWFADLLDDVGPLNRDDAVLPALAIAFGGTLALAGAGALLPRRWPALVTWALVLVLGAGLGLAATAWTLRPQLAGWEVREVGPGGRTLRVDVLADLSCDFEARVLELGQTPEVVELEGQATPERCIGGEGLLDRGQRDRRIRSVTVHLDRPVGDARITGRGQITRGRP